eukprot:1154243-Pelagomonas_calceolata.AAC.6
MEDLPSPAALGTACSRLEMYPASNKPLSCKSMLQTGRVPEMLLSLYTCAMLRVRLACVHTFNQLPRTSNLRLDPLVEMEN